MANFAYFADLPDGAVLEWRDTYQRPAKVGLFAPNEPGWTGGNVRCGYDPERGRVRITRTVQMKSYPSRHECDSRCLNASGRSMNCECACGGRNHGRGSFRCEAA